MTLSEDLLKIIVCPKCKGELKYDKEESELKCESCRLVFRVVDGIPILLMDEAKSF